ncbi:MAG: hypothetical protein FJW20_05645 [Acidimicrobiia bacterium]|nr:hypothetical protein [Acidimicrobiia bacterium]
MDPVREQLWRWLTEPRYLQAEQLVLAVLAAVWILRPGWGWHWIERIERRAVDLAGKPLRAALMLGAAVLGLRLALLPLFPVPEPHLPAEFAHLLAADTFAKGRAANPSHAHWEHFESPHVVHQPAYAAVSAPGQGLLLLLGKMAGHPWVAVVVAAAAVPGVLFWMLTAWAPPRWALLGACLAAMRWILYTYWINSYWSPALEVIGGSLAIGACGYMVRRGAVGRNQALAMAAGAAILALTRPYAGALVIGAVLAVVVARFKARSLPVTLWMAAVMAPVTVGIVYQQWRVTGDAWKPVQELYAETYRMARQFVFQEPRPEQSYRHEMLGEFHKWELEQQMMRRRQPAMGTVVNLAAIWRFLFGTGLTVALVGLPPALWRRKNRPLVFMAAVSLLGLSMETALYPQSLAPVSGLVLLFVLESMRRLHAWSCCGIPYGIVFGRAIVIACVAMLVVPPAAKLSGMEFQQSYASWWSIEWELHRPRLREQLEATPGKDLVLVRYLPRIAPPEEWVYNGADIDEEGIVWAREMDEKRTRELIDYFEGRRVWLLEANHHRIELKPYRSLVH